MKKKKAIIISIVSIAIILVLVGILAINTIGAEVITEKVKKISSQELKEVAIVENKNENNEEGVEETKVSSARAENEQRTVTTENWDLENVNIVEDTEGTPVPVPKGYVASGVDGEHTINTGFVIYEGEEEVNDTNKEEAQKTRNQWVWVPIYNPSEIYGTDSAGKKHGKLYNFDKNGRTALNWTESNGVMSITFSTDYREPDVVENYDNSGYLPNYLTEISREDLNEELQIEFEETIKSIEKYGGFYIGRYETGGLSTQAKVVKGNTDIASQTWYTMYRQSKTLNGTNRNVETNMIWGSLWDATLEWLVESGSKTYSEVGSDSTSWGNYSNSTVSGHGSKRATGYSEVWKANNIYDLAGNVCERTLEEYGTYYRSKRGDYFYSKGSSDPADARGVDVPSNTVTYCGSRRCTLYKVTLNANSDA